MHNSATQKNFKFEKQRLAQLPHLQVGKLSTREKQVMKAPREFMAELG